MRTDRFALAQMMKRAKAVEKVAFIEAKCQGKRVLDLGCVRHSAEFAVSDPNWLHKRIRAIASSVVGVDYLRDDVERLRTAGYDVVWGDVCEPLQLQQQFDVIVAGDLIEHLANFAGFFSNCQRLLRPGGELVLTTPNPFFLGECHYVALKRNFLINPEHTCWIDPQALAQLAARFGFQIADARFLSPAWAMPNFVTETRKNPYEILSGRWTNRKPIWRMLRFTMPLVFGLFYWPFYALSGGFSPLVRYSDYAAVLVQPPGPSSGP